MFLVTGGRKGVPALTTGLQNVLSSSRGRAPSLRRLAGAAGHTSFSVVSGTAAACKGHKAAELD